MRNKVLIATAFALLLVALIIGQSSAQTPTPTSTPTATPWPTLQPIPTPTSPVQCLDLTRGLRYRNMVTGTLQMLEMPRSVGVQVGSTFSTSDAQQKGFAAGSGAGKFSATVTAVLGPLGDLIPADVLIVIALRLLVILILAVIGLIGKAKVLIKWW
jgi:hypothetical protein